MTRLYDVKVGDRVLVVRGQEAMSWEVEAVDATTVTAGARVYDKASGWCRQRTGDRLRLRTPEEHERDLGALDLGRYLAALHLLIEDGADIEELAERLTAADLPAACRAGQQLCDLLGVRP